MPKVTFLPLGTTCEGEVGESILDVALNNDIPLQHVCGGFCACATCHVKVKSGKEFLSEQQSDELDRLEMASDISQESRLGCQSRLLGGDVTVEIMNLDQ